MLGAAFAYTPLAQAHAMGSGAGNLWGGVVHFFTSAIAIATAIGFGALIARSKDDVVVLALVVAGVAALIAGWSGLQLSLQWLAAVLTALGLLCVLGTAPGRALLMVLALIAGGCVGIASRLDVAGVVPALGVAVGFAATSAWSMELVSRVGARLRYTGNVVGAWVAALGLLLWALALSGFMDPR